jgi:hypothetical protein
MLSTQSCSQLNTYMQDYAKEQLDEEGEITRIKTTLARYTEDGMNRFIDRQGDKFEGILWQRIIENS